MDNQQGRVADVPSLYFILPYNWGRVGVPPPCSHPDSSATRFTILPSPFLYLKEIFLFSLKQGVIGWVNFW